MPKHEQIMVALFAALQTAVGVTVGRNVALPEVGSDSTTCTLKDGPIQPGDEFINPPVYEFTMTPTVLIIVSGGANEAARDAAIASVLDSLLATIAAITDLGGLTLAIRPQPPTTAPKELWGAADMKGAEFGIEIDYESDSSAG
ncbi:MAG: hypothetical protein HY834_08925 [Devosia nanyangense]|uniref:DUF3168 domain-containing protein n=1 Tax=Devosia nanyangense TaxID=1228055 RepID=A0A933NWF9_9HYPH|nr:hypothetical protein [Devosia nanyangense]